MVRRWNIPWYYRSGTKTIANKSGLRVDEKISEIMQYYIIIERNRKRFSRQTRLILNPDVCIFCSDHSCMNFADSHYLFAKWLSHISLKIIKHQLDISFSITSNDIADHVLWSDLFLESFLIPPWCSVSKWISSFCGESRLTLQIRQL